MEIHHAIVFIIQRGLHMAFSRIPLLIMLSACTLVLLSFGVRSSFGLFLAPISDAQGWGREVFALAIALQNLAWGVSQPFAGAVADRYGSGRVIAVGGVLYVAGVLMMSQASTPFMMHISAGLLIGFALSGTTFAVVLSALARVVPEEKRSWALGIGTAAGSLGQFLMVPLGQAFLTRYGWSFALVLLAFTAIAMIPLARALTGTAQSSGPPQSLPEALREALTHPGYWFLTAGFFVCGFHVAFIATHLPAYLTDAGLSAQIGAWALALVGFFNIIGAYTAGVLGGKHSKKYLLSSLYFGRAIAITIFMLVPLTNTSALIFSAIMGLLWLSTVPLTSGLVGQIFGPRYMATLFGIVFFSHQLGSFLGVWLGGRLFDTTGSYDLVWWAGAVLGVVSGWLHWPINERPVERAVAA